MNFGALIIGDEILSGKRVDAHFRKIASLLGERGLRLSWVQYLGDERARIAEALQRSFAAGDVVFSFGGIGNTPDDHTRQAAAEALGVDLVLQPEAERELRELLDAQMDKSARMLLAQAQFSEPHLADLLTNMAAGMADKRLDGDEVLATANRRGPVFEALVAGIVAALP